MYPRDETTLEKLFSLLPRRFLLWAQNASLPGLEPAWPGVCKPERRGRVKVTVYFPPLTAIPEEQGSGKNEVCLSNFNSSVDVINDDQSGKEMLLERGCCIPSFVTQCCCVWFWWFSGNEFDFSNDLYMHQIYSLNLLNVILELSVTLRFKFTSKLWSTSIVLSFYISTILSLYFFVHFFEQFSIRLSC